MEAGGGASELAHGTLIGQYRIEALLGEGGMGKVFRAVREGETDPIALKVMRSRLSGDEESRKRFLREARAAAEVRHSHLVPVLDAGESGDRRYLVMPYVPGQNLDTRLGDGPLPVLGACSKRRSSTRTSPEIALIPAEWTSRARWISPASGSPGTSEAVCPSGPRPR